MRFGLLAAVLAFGRLSDSGAPTRAPAAGSAPWAVDGDTVLLSSGERLRLLSVDCPETGRPGAEAARLLTQDALDRAGPGPLVLEPAEVSRDRYGRILADLRVQGQSVSLDLVAAGLGWIYRSQDEDLLSAQARAVAWRRGIHVVLDHPISDGPFLLTTHSFHRPGCGLVRQRAANLPRAARAADPLAEGKAPCRRCLAWPPEPAFGSLQIMWQPEGERALRGR